MDLLVGSSSEINSLFDTKNTKIIKNTTETITYGNNNEKNDSNGIFDTAYITIL